MGVPPEFPLNQKTFCHRKTMIMLITLPLAGMTASIQAG
jgi:hypothetical protein